MEYRLAIDSEAPGVAEVLIQSYNIDTKEEGTSAFREKSGRGIRYVVAVEEEKVVG